MSDADPDLVVPGVRRLVAEEQKVELPTSNSRVPHRIDDRVGGRLRVPFRPIRLQEDAAVGADRHAVPELLLCLGRAEREHDDLTAARFDDAHGLLDGALLVRADREAEVPRLERLRVVGQDHAPAGDRDPLDGAEDLHERILSLSGSKGARDPTMSTVTG